MKGFVQDIESLAVKNDEFRRVLYTAKHCQLVVMALKPKEEIGAEVHKLDQFFRVEEGTGEAVLDGVRTAIRAGFAVVVPAGDESQHHQYRQCSTEALYALCAAESSGRRRPPYPRRRGGRQRTLRRQDDGIIRGEHRWLLNHLKFPLRSKKAPRYHGQRLQPAQLLLPL